MMYSKIDLRMINKNMYEICPFLETLNVNCNTELERPSQQYVCECYKNEPAPQTRRKYNGMER